MKLMSYTKNETGWTLDLDTEKKPWPRVAKSESIKQSEFFPKIALINDGFPPKPGELKVYGTIVVKGTMRFFPVTKTEKKQNTLYWGRYVGEEQSVVLREVSGFIPRQKDTMNIGFDKEYVFDGTEWVPFMVWQHLNEAKGLVADDGEKLFHKVMASAGSDIEAIQTVLDAFKTDVKHMNMPLGLKGYKPVPVEVAERASTFHYSGETKSDYSPFNGPALLHKRKLSEVIPEVKYMSSVQLAMAKRMGLVAA